MVVKMMVEVEMQVKYKKSCLLNGDIKRSKRPYYTIKRIPFVTEICSLLSQGNGDMNPYWFNEKMY